MEHTVSAQEALQRLIEGNRTYAQDHASQDHAHADHRHHHIAEQRPFAVVLGCSDSRVPVEIVFNQTLGKLFVIRVAGNVLSDHVIGSMEYAVETFGSSLILVLGHSHCGAVSATVDAVLKKESPRSRVAEIVKSIRPAVESVSEDANVLEAAIKAHVRSVVEELRGEEAFKPALHAGKLAILGAEYHLETGLVEILTPAIPTLTERSSARAVE
ncbi:MAG: carbonic anhydrase [Vulcanimicrobiaceae bacterium]